MRDFYTPFMLRDRNRLLSSLLLIRFRASLLMVGLPSASQAVFESCAEGIEGGALLGLEELLLDLFLLLRQIFGENGLMSDDFVDDPGAAELRRCADLAHRHAEGGLKLMA